MLRLEYVAPETLTEHPHNWKIHDRAQLDALGDLMGAVGWAGALLHNERTGRLLDGHGRLAIARRSSAPVPVLVGSWSEEQERQILLYLDPTGWMSRADAKALDALLAGADASALLAAAEGAPLATLLEAVKAAGELLKPEPETAGEPGNEPLADGEPEPVPRPAAASVPNALWPTDNAWGVPLLDLAMQADAVEAPVTVWGTQGQTRKMGGTWVFYAPDESFDALWLNPAKVLPSGAPCIVEPNWSTTDQAPFAVALWGIYRRRWLARYWQSQGRRVFVDLNVHHDLLAPHPATAGAIPALLGVPKRWKAYATRAHGNRPEMLESEHAVALSHAETDSILFLVYGGGKRVEELAKARGWAWVPERNDARRKSQPSSDESKG